MRRYSVLFAVAAGLIFAVGTGPAVAHHPEGFNLSDDPVDGPLAGPGHQHGGDEGHLPASSKNVELVGKVELTNVESGVADVAAHGDYAYLGASSPECAGRQGARGTGVHVVDISDAANPSKVGFLPAEANSYVGEGVHVISFGGRDILVHNNETCNSDNAVVSGFSVWDVTNPRSPSKLGQFGDATPAVTNQTYHTTHSVQGFTWRDRAYVVAQDNQELKDVDIFDITPLFDGNPTTNPVLVAERGLEDWPGAQGSYANGDTVNHHDMQQKVIDGHNYLAVSYWDAGQVLLNIDDPAAPAFVGDSDYLSPDREFPSFTQPEGNSHQSYFDQDGDWLISTDEDFSPTRILFEITSGPAAGQYGGGEFSWTKRIPGAGIAGSRSVWGGSGCTSDQNGNGTPDRSEVPSAAATGADIVVFSRGVCFFSDKVRSGEEAGYSIVLIAQSHGGSRNGLLPDGFSCGGQGSAVLGTAYGLCIGHRALHLLFGNAPAYASPESFAAGGDMPAIGTLGHGISAKPTFDGWGYVSLHDARSADLPVVDTYAVAESKDPAFAQGFGNLTVHEVKTDPRRNKDLAYFSYYNAGLRVATFGPDGLTEVGHFIGEGGNDFWGVFPVCAGQCRLNDRDQGRGRHNEKRPLLLLSDRDSGLWILRYTGQE